MSTNVHNLPLTYFKLCRKRYSLLDHAVVGGSNEFLRAHTHTPVSGVDRCPRRRCLHNNAPISNSEATNNEALVLYDSLSKSYQRITLSSSGKGLAWYTCGPTTYAPAHLGHARTYVWIDILRRILEFVTERHHGIPPLFVMNITDVDDKILAAAKESSSGDSPLQLARRFENEFWRDMDALGCLRPHVVTRVTEHVQSAIVPYIHKLESNGVTYHVLGDGVYFDVRAFEAKFGHLTKYGKLAPPTAATDFFDNHHPRQTGETARAKHDERDFALWKCRKPGEEMFWESPWGPGRPGWHIECSAMIEAIQDRFGDSHVFRVHAGGIDLKFPHHTNEIAQAEAYIHGGDATRWTGEWIPRWVHTGHVHIDGLKMSKSLKNFITIKELLFQDDEIVSPLVSPADDFRLWCLGMSGSYRASATFSFDRIQEARILRQKIVRFLLDGEDWIRRAAGEGLIKLWRDVDIAFFNKVNDAFTKCLKDLLGSDMEAASCELNGASFLEHLLDISEAGGDYLRNASYHNTPIEPLIAALSTIRKLLSLVGFTNATSRAGLQVITSDPGRVDDGEAALIDEFVRFRTLVRQAALTSSSDSEARELRNQILEYSDDVRRNRLPTIGIEIMDRKVGADEDDMSEPTWRYCLPKSPTNSESTPQSETSPTSLPPAVSLIVPLEDYFRVGKYHGMFSEFNDEGIPTHTADGLPVSKTMLKKLQKKREKYQERITRTTKTSS